MLHLETGKRPLMAQLKAMAACAVMVLASSYASASNSVDTSETTEPLVAVSQGPVNIPVLVEGLQASGGQVVAYLFATRESFPNIEKAIVKVAAEIGEDGRALVNFANIMPGSYAITVHEDKDKDGEIDKGMLGLSLERFAFSRNARVPYGLPSFDHARVNITEKIKPIVIDIASGIYP